MTESSIAWAVDDDPAGEDLAIVSEGVIQFGRTEAAGGNPRPIACFLRDSGEIIAGATGRTEFNRLFVGYLWVTERLRGQGLGSEALKRIEGAARERGSSDALIETLSDRTVSLYQRLGYVVVASIDRYVGGFTKYVLIKDLQGNVL
jgi:GNAT superfamily N-acetyltransferase